MIPVNETTIAPHDDQVLQTKSTRIKNLKKGERSLKQRRKHPKSVPYTIQGVFTNIYTNTTYIKV